ncbi:TRAP dicarboxylate transporter small permease[DctQ] component [Octadecabacter arcticus 238]|jgi:C4-dicarboxylate transporter DctQ subunit|uniref:TRAP transporter small permease protein n=1 Tax=Octadecabacter arcticus 238 TaxID=391616 RepID=M9RFW8_9RHOB|nr:TRAP transporter small permease [Octadecabacter arcticus]AGI71459.1 TRAP dicarboxylate transporter small permease[DctQ] component [Octadecabacter arcticus 238]
MSGVYSPKGRLGAIVHTLEESIIALLLGLMTIVTFINVVMRYGFNSQLIWGLELTLVLFAWLVLFGISYGFKVVSHLGVDAVLNLVGPTTRKRMGILATAICIFYALLLLKGGWDYWAPFAGLDATTGRVIPGIVRAEDGAGLFGFTFGGFFENSRDQGWYETEQLPIPFAQTWLENTFNVGEPYEKMPRFVPYMIVPFAMALMLYRLVQSLMRILRGEIDTIIVSHEAEDAVEDAGKSLSEDA